ncbi:MAG: hypothetical protein V4506_04305 [Bacteroidota bacterium]
MLFVAQFKKQKIVTNNISSFSAIFDSDLNNVPLRENYITRLSGEAPKLVIAREELKKSVTVFCSLLNLFFFLISLPCVFLISVFSKNKLRAPLHILNLIEALHLLTILKKNRINKLHFFNIYEHDANLLAYSISKSGIYVNKIPSEVPLSFWNKIIVADSLSFCFRYQHDEYKEYKSTMFVKETNDWVPEISYNLEPFYRSTFPKIAEKTIGFYSSGMWLRKKLGRIETGNKDYENELNLLEVLLNFVKERNAYTLKVFLHPLEKKHLQQTKEYYNTISTSIVLADVNIANAEQFYNADVAVTLVSTLAYERLFWGFKTIVYPVAYSNFPIKESSFRNVCALSETELKEKIHIALEQTTEDFFKNNNIENYRYNNYKTFNS